MFQDVKFVDFIETVTCDHQREIEVAWKEHFYVDVETKKYIPEPNLVK